MMRRPYFDRVESVEYLQEKIKDIKESNLPFTAGQAMRLEYYRRRLRVKLQNEKPWSL